LGWRATAEEVRPGPLQSRWSALARRRKRAVEAGMATRKPLRGQILGTLWVCLAILAQIGLVSGWPKSDQSVTLVVQEGRALQ
jgi:hypothetical protein